MNLKLKKILLGAFISTISVALFFHIQPTLKELKVPLNIEIPSKHWIVCKFMECEASSVIYHHWIFMCFDNYENIKIFYKGNQILDMLSIKDESDQGLMKYFYLAIENGAETVFLANDKKDLQDNDQRLQTIQFKNARRIELPDTVSTFNSSLWFGCQSIPVSDSYDDDQTKPLLCTNSSLPGLSVPAVVPKTLPCDPLVPDIVLSSSSFVPILFSKSIFSQCAFIFLPLIQIQFVNHSQQEHYSCLVQHLLKKVGCHVSVHWAGNHEGKQLNTCQKFISQTSNLSFKENTMSVVFSVFVKSLSYEHKMDFEKWFLRLKNLERSFMQFPKQTKKCSPTIINQFLPFKNIKNIKVENIDLSKQLYSKICTKGEYGYNLTDITKPWHQRPNILLLISFNHPIFAIFPLIEIIYRPFYPNILYCADRLPNKTEIGNYRASFVTYSNKEIVGFKGYLINDCVNSAFELKLNFDGVFMVSDDSLLRHGLLKFPVDKVWYQKNYAQYDILKNTYCLKKKCYNPSSIQKLFPMIPTYKKWVSISAEDKEMKRYLDTLSEVLGGPYRMAYITLDTYYIPKRLYYDFHKISGFFVREKQYLAVTTVNSILSVDNTHDFSYLSIHDHALFNNDNRRNTIWKWYGEASKENVTFFHPMKLKLVIQKDYHTVDFFCRCLVPYLYDPNGFICQHSGEPQKVGLKPK